MRKRPPTTEPGPKGSSGAVRSKSGSRRKRPMRSSQWTRLRTSSWSSGSGQMELRRESRSPDGVWSVCSTRAMRRSSSILPGAIGALQLFEEPAARVAEFALHGAQGQAEGVGGLLVGEAEEELEVDDGAPVG